MSLTDFRNLSASHAERTTGARLELDQWRKEHPNFTSRELLDHWRSIREVWGLIQNTSKRRT